MNVLRAIISCALFLLMFGCEPTVMFTEPQPVSKDDLNKFPGRIQGVYVSLADSTELVISDYFIFRQMDVEETLDPNALDSTLKIIGDTLVNTVTHEQARIVRVSDMLTAQMHLEDTLFNFAKGNVLRKMKGYFFLNTQVNDSSWEVKTMKLSRGKLTVSTIRSEPDLEKLAELSETPLDTVSPYLLTPTKKQFKQFLKMKGFAEDEVFVRK